MNPSGYLDLLPRAIQNALVEKGLRFLPNEHHTFPQVGNAADSGEPYYAETVLGQELAKCSATPELDMAALR